MKAHRIFAMILRNFYTLKRSFDRVTDTFWWPAIDILLWGLTSSFFTQFNTGSIDFASLILSGVIFWIIVYRGQYETNVSFLDEIWARNVINIFAAPLTFAEWVVGSLVVSLIKVFCSVAFASVIGFFLYKVSIISFGWYFFIFAFLLLITAWSVGFIVSSFILRYGSRLQALTWTIIGILSPFSAIYYPVSILPQWAQDISRFIPTSYIFENVRLFQTTGNVDGQSLVICLLLNIGYFCLSLFFLRKSFDAILEKGLIKVF